MSTLYKIVGTDGREYGPVSAEQIRQWIAESRVERQTPVFAEGAKDWTYLGLLPEFAMNFESGATPSPIAPPKPTGLQVGQSRRTNSYATAGLIFGILSMTCCCGCPFNILGIVFSLIALSQIKRQPELYNGKGLAIAGLILSIIGLLANFGLTFLELMMNQPHLMWQFKTF